MFFINGAAAATWVPLIPTAQQKLGLSAGELGIALLGVAVGAVISTPSTGWLVGRAGGRRVVTLAAVLSCAVLPLLPVAPTLPMLTLALVVFGAALGTMDVAMNIHGSVVEALYQRPLMSTFHGFYSIGGFAGALTGGALAALGLAPFIARSGPRLFSVPPPSSRTTGFRLHSRTRRAVRHGARTRWSAAVLAAGGARVHGALQSPGRGSQRRLERHLSPQIARDDSGLRCNCVRGVLGGHGCGTLERRLADEPPRRNAAAAHRWCPRCSRFDRDVAPRPARVRRRRIRFDRPRSLQRGPNTLQRRRSIEYPWRPGWPLPQSRRLATQGSSPARR